MTQSSTSGGSLYGRLRLLRRVLPLLASLTVLVYETIEHGVLATPIAEEALVAELFIYGLGGPTIAFLVLTWILRRLRERDEAEARLAALYEVSSQSAAAKGLEELQELALTIPQQLGFVDGRASLVVQDGPDRPWLLADAVGLNAAEISALQIGLASGELQPECDRSLHIESSLSPSCPLLKTIAPHSPDPPTAALCLALSRESSRRPVLTIYLPDRCDLPSQFWETLESMRAGFVVAFDRASLRVRERQLLQQIEQAVRTERLGHS